MKSWPLDWTNHNRDTTFATKLKEFKSQLPRLNQKLPSAKPSATHYSLRRPQSHLPINKCLMTNLSPFLSPLLSLVLLIYLLLQTILIQLLHKIFRSSPHKCSCHNHAFLHNNLCVHREPRPVNAMFPRQPSRRYTAKSQLSATTWPYSVGTTNFCRRYSCRSSKTGIMSSPQCPAPSHLMFRR